ncbi:homocysteine S-methyltransferase family protein [Gottschalkiaceae bacterium SANA]|nr:homocysteine S-methyltransferase family protein [Gottschalkiaceae bacterium SANA]
MMSIAWKEQLGQEIFFFDGAMGTMIQAADIAVPAVPEELNIDHPQVIQGIHEAFIRAGANFITTNTFGANRLKLEKSRYPLQRIINAAVDVAHAAVSKAGGDVHVVYNIGPIGAMMKPIGSLDFDTAYEIFKEQVICLDPMRIDAVLIETMTDISEMRAAILAVKENSTLPIFATMSFTEDERTLTGTDPETMVRILEGLQVDVLGVNCSLGPVEMMEIVNRIIAVSKTPVIVQANAGLPVCIDGETQFSLNAGKYAMAVTSFMEAGVALVGGCCGTTPEYIQKLVEKQDRYQPIKEKRQSGNFLCSSTMSLDLDDGFVLIGERINPSGNKRLKEAFKQGDFQFATKVAFEQIHHGAQVLDINTSLPQIDEEEVMIQLVDSFSGLLDTPLQFDSVKASVLEAALRRYAGIAIVNSINGKQSSMDELFPLIKKYGAYAVCLCLDEKGIPHTAEERIAIAEKLIKNAKKHGIPEERLLIDALVLTASAQQEEVMETLKTIRILKERYAVKTTLGVSNVSYGLPYRPLINQVFFTLALGAGLDTAIINPGAEGIVDTIQAFQVLNNQDPGAVEYIAYNERKKKPDSQGKPAELKNQDNSLVARLLQGDEQEVEEIIREYLEQKAALAVVDKVLIPALDTIGLQYERQEIFLPQLIRAAETVKGAFELVKEKLAKDHGSLEPKGTVALATVKGDIHDIGKNLVKIMLESYGYRVVDLGKDVGGDAILTAIRNQQIQLVGLSALMTTTVVGMEEIIQAIREEFNDVKIMVGGAVLTEEYAKQIGADFYCRDARASVLVADQVLQ